MKSPTQALAVAIVQMLLFVFLLPIIVIIFLLSFINKKIDWRKVTNFDAIKDVFGGAQPTTKSKPTGKKKSQEESTTYDVTFASKAR
jgi:hypothetical protein